MAVWLYVNYITHGARTYSHLVQSRESKHSLLVWIKSSSPLWCVTAVSNLRVSSQIISLLSLFFYIIISDHSLRLCFHSKHSHSLMTLISLPHTLSLSNPLLSSLVCWLLHWSSVALPYPFLIGCVYCMCVCVRAVPYFSPRVFPLWLKSPLCWFSTSSFLDSAVASHTIRHIHIRFRRHCSSVLYTSPNKMCARAFVKYLCTC